MTASLGMSEPEAGSDLAGPRTTAELVGDHFVVSGQKVGTSGAHDADVVLTVVRTDSAAPKYKGVSALLIRTDTPGVVCRPFASVYERDDLDFNEVFFTDVRGKPARPTQWRVAGRRRLAGPQRTTTTHLDVGDFSDGWKPPASFHAA
jgi:alkylation response protein AidB-like acyl-CoA dehydrogenase